VRVGDGEEGRRGGGEEGRRGGGNEAHDLRNGGVQQAVKHDVVIVQVLERDRRIPAGEIEEGVVASCLCVAPPAVVMWGRCYLEGESTLRNEATRTSVEERKGGGAPCEG
jgi:hypothetical protein